MPGYLERDDGSLMPVGVTTEWYTSHTNLVALAGFLVDEGDFTTPQAVVDFFEKPWHYDDEWARYQAEVDIPQALRRGYDPEQETP